MRPILMMLLVMFLAACDEVVPQAPTLTPTRAMSGPTIEPSATVLNFLPTEIPPDYIGPGQTIPQAADIPFNSVLPPLDVTPSAAQAQRGIQPVQISLTNERVVIGDLYENPPVELEQGLLQQRLPGVMFIGADSNTWGNMPAQIRDSGHTVLVIDLGTGATSEDFVLAIRAFSETVSVNPGSMAVLGVEQGADLALIGCSIEPLCDAAVLISPRSRDTLLNVLITYNPRPLMVVASRDDAEAYDTAVALQNSALGSFSLQEYEGELTGFDLLASQSGLPGIVRQWLARFLVI